MEVFYLKKRDTRPILEVALLNPDGTALDLTGAGSVTLHVKLRGGTVITRAMVVDVVPTTGVARYTWVAADWTDPTPLVAGQHQMEYEVISGTSRMTFPNGGYDELRILDDLGQA